MKIIKSWFYLKLWFCEIEVDDVLVITETAVILKLLRSPTTI